MQFSETDVMAVVANFKERWLNSVLNVILYGDTNGVQIPDNVYLRSNDPRTQRENITRIKLAELVKQEME